MCPSRKTSLRKTEKITNRKNKLPQKFRATRYTHLHSQTKMVGTLSPNAVFSVLARLLVLPMLVIAVNSPNLADHHWRARRQQSVPTTLTETVACFVSTINNNGISINL